jgi:hypothetical protein
MPRSDRGALGGEGGGTRVHASAEPIQKAPTHLLFCPPRPAFLIEFVYVSQQVEFKNTTKKLCEKKIHVENALQKNKKNSMSFFPVLFLLILLEVFLHREFKNTESMSVEKNTKNLKNKLPTHLRGRFFFSAPWR